MSPQLRTNTIFNDLSSIERIAPEHLKPPKRPLRAYTARHKRQFARCIEQLGLLNPILVDAENNILGGLAWFLGAQVLDLPDIPVVRVRHLSNEQIRAYRIAEQRFGEMVPWNDQELAEELSELSSLDPDFDLEITGFSHAEIETYTSILNNNENNGTIEHVQDPIGPAVTSQGDIWLLDDHRIVCGSALDDLVWRKLMDGKKAALAFTDPPYNVPIQGHVSGKGEAVHREFAMASGEMTAEQFAEFLDATCRVLASHSTDGSLHCICMDWRHIGQLLEAGNANYSNLINICVWVKHNAGMGSFYRSQHEFVAVFKNGTAAHRNNVELGRHGRNRSNVWNFPGATSFAGRKTDEGNLLALHPTVKPVALIAEAILDSTIRKEIVIDPFLGSGSTLLAAERTRRKLYGIELDPLYVDVIIRRWQRYTGSRAIQAESGEPFDVIAERWEASNAR